MITTYFTRRKRSAKISSAVLAAIFLSVTLVAFNFDLSDAIAQVQGQNSNNFGTFGTYNYSNEVNNGTTGIWRSITGSGNGSYNTAYSNAYTQDPFKVKFGTTNMNVELSKNTSGVTGFIKSLFSGSSTAVNSTYNAYNNGYNAYGSNNAYNAYNNLYNANTITTTNVKPGQFGYPQTGSTAYNTTYNTTTGNYNYYTTTPNNLSAVTGLTAQKLGGGALAKFFGGIIDGVSFVGGKAVYAGEKAIFGLTNVSGRINMGMAASTTGLVGTIGKVLGFGARVVIGAAKVAITIPVLAVKAGVYLTTLACAGTVRVLGGGLNALKTIVGANNNNVNQLGYSITGLARETVQSLGTQNVNYNVNGANLPVNYNNQQFGTQLNNSMLYANQVQQNMTTSQGLVNTIQTGAQKTMNNFKINTKLAGITLLELGTKLVYKTASLVSGSASNVSLALAQSIMNMENTKTNLRLLKQLNSQGVVNPYLYQQYLSQAQLGVTNSQNLFGTANQNINNSYLSTLSNINQTQNYINSNSLAITNQMNQYGNSLYTQNLPYNTLNQYNNGYTTLNNSYGTLNGTFGYSQPANQQTTSTTSNTLSNLFNFNEGASAERKPDTGSAAGVENREQSPEVKKAYENYLASYNKYIELISKDGQDGKAVDSSAALEEYKKAYSEYEAVANKAASGVK
ncbi:MAG TPA: hypothetical protein DC017_14980 [Candidatus Wallbacteria bacterium]|nr:hypothetical protein [Candidatus Wallbacteria bacterium]